VSLYTQDHSRAGYQLNLSLFNPFVITQSMEGPHSTVNTLLSHSNMIHLLEIKVANEQIHSHTQNHFQTIRSSEFGGTQDLIFEKISTQSMCMPFVLHGNLQFKFIAFGRATQAKIETVVFLHVQDTFVRCMKIIALYIGCVFPAFQKNCKQKSHSRTT
jgi:hypothetical protein